MGSCSSKEEPDDDGPVGGGLDGWSVGQEASMTPQQAAVSIRHSLIARSDLASKGRGLVGNEVGPEAIRHDDVRLQELSSSQVSPSGRSKGVRQQSFERRPGGAPTERQSSFERRPGGGIQPKHSFPACVLCNFDAVAPDVPGVPQIELRVSRGELVTVEIHPDMPPPDGWCLCSVRREGEPVTRGLVPWRFLVSAAHAELDVRAIQLTLPTDLGGIEEVEKGARLAQEVRTRVLEAPPLPPPLYSTPTLPLTPTPTLPLTLTRCASSRCAAAARSWASRSTSATSSCASGRAPWPSAS